MQSIWIYCEMDSKVLTIIPVKENEAWPFYYGLYYKQTPLQEHCYTIHCTTTEVYNPPNQYLFSLRMNLFFTMFHSYQSFTILFTSITNIYD